METPVKDWLDLPLPPEPWNPRPDPWPCTTCPFLVERRVIKILSGISLSEPLC